MRLQAHILFCPTALEAYEFPVRRPIEQICSVSLGLESRSGTVT